MDYVYKALNKVLGVYSLVIIVVGTLANLLSAVLCLKKELRKTPTFIFYAFVFVADTISLYFWNLDTYLFVFSNYMIEMNNYTTCILVTVVQCTSFQFSAWLLVSIRANSQP